MCEGEIRVSVLNHTLAAQSIESIDIGKSKHSLTVQSAYHHSMIAQSTQHDQLSKERQSCAQQQEGATEEREQNY